MAGRSRGVTGTYGMPDDVDGFNHDANGVDAERLFLKVALLVMGSDESALGDTGH